MFMRERLKWLLFPGLNLHARLRFGRLPSYLRRDTNGKPRSVLDAGCGNGMLSYRCYQMGDSVTGISIKEGEIARDKRLFNGMLGIPEDRMRFLVHNLYKLNELGMKFDAIICTEVLEHIADDSSVCRLFWDSLNPGGVLHLCCPNAEHPDNVTHAIDEGEGGGHVRAGYTFESYRALLEPIGFRIKDEVGLGGPVRQACNKRILAAERRLGVPAACAVFALVWPFSHLDTEPRVPYSLYVRAVKPA